jgi:hypothetical protein
MGRTHGVVLGDPIDWLRRVSARTASTPVVPGIVPPEGVELRHRYGGRCAHHVRSETGEIRSGALDDLRVTCLEKVSFRPQ